MRLRDLTIGYADKGVPKPLIRSINADIQAGEVVCLLGQNGVGKSSLLRTLAGIQLPLHGEIWLGQQQLASYSLQALAAELSIVLTEKTAAGNLLTEELVALGRSPYTGWLGLLSADDKARVDEAIAVTKINYLLGKKIGELSDGQYQKAMIARAVAQDGNLMLLDEPTAFLDLNNSVEIFVLLRRLAHEKGKAVIVSTHDLHLAMEFADKLWLTNFNAPLVQGLPEDLALNGELEASIYHESFGYDLLNGRVLLPKSYKVEVFLEGDTPVCAWTKRALERHGYQIGNEKAPFHLTIAEAGATTTWSISGEEFTSLEGVLHFLSGRRRS